MEIFVDFGLFEIVAALGLSAVARHVYARSALRLLFPAVSIAAPAAVILLAPTEGVRWLGAACLATALVNLAVVLAVIQRGEIPRLEFRAIPRAPGRRS
jgi:hypothetical protein